MTHVAALPPALSAAVAILVILGAALALVGSFGLLRLKDFYDRVHPPTMGTTLGLGFVLAASMLMFSTLEGRPVIHEVVIAVFMVVTTPVTYMLLLRAARHREPAVREAALRDGAASNVGRETTSADDGG